MAITTIPSSGTTDGTNMVLLSTTTASDDSSIAFDNTIVTDTYLTYFIVGEEVKTASDNTAFGVRISTDNGSTYTTSGYARVTSGYRSNDTNATAGFQGGASDSWMFLTGVRHNHGNATNEKINFTGYLHGFRNSTSHKYMSFISSFTSHDGSMSSMVGTTGSTNVTAKVNNFKFEPYSGNITSGKFSVYGVRT